MDYWLIINAIIVFTIAFALSSICVPLVIKLAIKKRLLGEYGEGRHVHKGYVPRLGGVAIYIGFFLSQTYFIISHQGAGHLSQAYLLLIFSSTLIFCSDPLLRKGLVIENLCSSEDIESGCRSRSF